LKYEQYPSRSAKRNYFPLPNEIFSLGLSTGEIATYAYLMRCEDRETYQRFDEKTGRLQIRRAVTSKKGGGVKVGETKTEKGTRSIQLPPSTVEILKQRKKKSYSEWIFHNPTVPELPLSPEMAYRRMKTLLRYAELPPIRFHDLRHTFATHALTSGVDAKTLSGILGHTNASFTLDTYTHMTTEMQKKASGIVGNFLEEIM